VNLALIGNCAYQALIDEQAAVKWLCWPRFDSSFVFGSLLDDDAGVFSVRPAADEFSSEQHYVEHTNVLRTEFRGQDGRFEVVDFAPRFLQHDRSFKPSMLIRRLRPLEGSPLIRIMCDPRYDYGSARPRSYVASNHIQWLLEGARLRLTTNAPLTYVSESRPFVLDRDIYLVLTWGEPLEAGLADTCESFLTQTVAYWRRWVKHANIPSRFQEAVIRSALVLKLHQFEDTGAITAATTTSLPEYPGSGRNWDYRFCWLRDSCFTLGALRRLGHFEEMEGFLSYLHNIAAASSNRLQPVYGIGGETELEERILEHLRGYDGSGTVRAGNAAFAQEQHDVYGEMLAAITPLYLDVRFAEQWDLSLLESLLVHVENKLESPDCGIWEKRAAPRLHTFSLLMHWAGARACARAASYRGQEGLTARADALAKRARHLIETRTWRATPGFFAETVDDDHADASLLMMVNLGFLEAGDPRASSHVDVLAAKLRVNDHLIHRYIHDDGIGETHATFTVCGFWYAEALARIGRCEQAEQVFAKLLDYRNHVGLLSEDIDATTRVQWGNFPQTYSHVGIINAAFALSPLADVIL